MFSIPFNIPTELPPNMGTRNFTTVHELLQSIMLQHMVPSLDNNICIKTCLQYTKYGKWSATSHTHVAVLQCCHMSARTAWPWIINLSWLLVCEWGIWPDAETYTQARLPLLRKAMTTVCCLLQWTYNHSMNHTEQPLSNDYYQYTTNCKSYDKRLYEKDTRKLNITSYTVSN